MHHLSYAQLISERETVKTLEELGASEAENVTAGSKPAALFAVNALLSGLGRTKT